MKIIPSSLHRLPLLLAAGLALVGLTGCGGGGGGVPQGGNTAQVNNLAPTSISGRTLTFTDPDQSQFQTVYVFQTSGYTSPNGDSGTYTYQQTPSVVNQASLHLNSSFSPPLTYTLTFNNFNGGNYVDQVGKTGPFTMQ